VTGSVDVGEKNDEILNPVKEGKEYHRSPAEETDPVDAGTVSIKLDG